MKNQGNSFGAFKGVFVPSILTILGVILFLRLGWIVGHSGLYSTFIIITLSSTITLITGLSISSTATNTDLGPGGSYFLISRCFGVEPGAAVGIPLYFAQALGISFYVVGFAESLQLFFPDLPVSTVAFVTLVVLTAVTFLSSELALKMQIFILVAIVSALLVFWLGSPVEVSLDEPVLENIPTFGFWAIFAIFFPAVTGIEAGISMSGDLKNPRKSLPVGTLSAVIIGYVVYMFSAYMFSIFAPRDLLISNSLLMTEIAYVPILIFIGLWGATLSSTMGALLGAPRTMQALAKDKILPHFLSIGSKKTNDPRAATLVSFIIAACGILLGDLNAIASVLSMFFLTSYGALNLVSGLEGLIDNPSWRPTFRISWLLSFIGAFLCFGAMFMIDSGASFIAIAAVLFIYYVMKKRKVKSNYSDIRSGLVTHFARNFVYKLNLLKTDARNWRPNFLIMTGAPKSRFHLIDLANTISHERGFMTVTSILTDLKLSYEKKNELEASTQSFLKKKNIEALTKVARADSLSNGVEGLLEFHGIGPITPNTLIIGDTSDPKMISEHTKILEIASLHQKNVIVVKDQKNTSDLIKKGGKSIDIWWRGHTDNISLILTLAYMLNTSTKWKNAKLTLKSVVNSPEEKKGIESNLQSFLESSRISAKYEFYEQDNTSDIYSTIAVSSKKADMVFMGLKSPVDAEDYESYYQNLMKKTDSLNTVCYVLEGEKISFMDIFQ